MDHEEVLRLFDRQMRREVPADHPGVRVEDIGTVVRQSGGPADWNGVVFSDIDESTADAVIAEQVRHYGALGVEFEWKTYSHDRPADLGERLVRAGFVAGEPESLMIAEVAPQTGAVELAHGLRLVDATDAAGIELAAQVHDEAFGTDGSRLKQQLLDRLAHAPDSFVMTLALAGERPVSAARIEFAPGVDFAGLWGGGTVAEFRGRGIYRALVAHRARIAAARGITYLQVDAMPTSRPILERLGFEQLSVTTPYVWKA
ncbi:GNAT family N-acetyltransferase [Streptomyces sp. TRM66268-LWL]|uniref:GNAT family N-acetyltransferase n=1 Tax=Streptomyces polyasparticus TaxID=2767826 RepID=A0ABR7SFG8_9ACTN|nr:GNAT family N-acetyltransferase [Streptomyces polyasparticus]MBC9713619.1 GNAT family N-acetyltransferase [Streptomyces polyasparticus]